MSADAGAVGRREVAYRLFAVEYEDADLEYSDSDEERAPNYVVTPAGARVNRLFVVGVLTEVEPVSEDVLRARVVDPTGAFVAYAGQYQPDAVGFLEDTDVPSFVSLTGKARTFQPDGSDRVFTSVRPESITAVDAATRDRWTVQAAEHTLARVATMARALEREERGDALSAALREAGVDPGLASGVALAIDHYGTTPAYLAALREQAIAAAEVVAADREAVPEFDVSPEDDGPVEGDLTAAPAVAGTLNADAEIEAPSIETGGPSPDSEPATEEPPAEAEPIETAGPATEEPPTEAEPSEAAEPAADVEPSPESESSPAADPAPDEPTADELGDFEGPDVSAEAESEPSAERYEMDDEERAEVEAEFGTEFSTGSEVGEPGEAGIEPETEPPATESAEAEPEPDADMAAEPEPIQDDEPDASAHDGSDAEGPDAGAAPSDVELEDVVVETMADLDDGDGVGRDTVVDAVVESHAVERAAVEDAIQEALMGGRCYEPEDGRLKAI